MLLHEMVPSDVESVYVKAAASPSRQNLQMGSPRQILSFKDVMLEWEILKDVAYQGRIALACPICLTAANHSIAVVLRRPRNLQDHTLPCREWRSSIKQPLSL